MASKSKNVFKERAALVKPPILKLNRKLLVKIFKYLTIQDLGRLRTMCRRLNNTVEYYVQDLQVFVEWDEEENYMVGFQEGQSLIDIANLIS